MRPGEAPPPSRPSPAVAGPPTGSTGAAVGASPAGQGTEMRPLPIPPDVGGEAVEPRAPPSYSSRPPPRPTHTHCDWMGCSGSCTLLEAQLAANKRAGGEKTGGLTLRLDI